MNIVHNFNLDKNNDLLLNNIQLCFWPISRAIAAMTILTGPVTNSSNTQWNEIKVRAGAGKPSSNVLVGRLRIVIHLFMSLKYCVLFCYPIYIFPMPYIMLLHSCSVFCLNKASGSPQTWRGNVWKYTFVLKYFFYKLVYYRGADNEILVTVYSKSFLYKFAINKYMLFFLIIL